METIKREQERINSLCYEFRNRINIHRGDYMDWRFFDIFTNSNNDTLKRVYLPIPWRSVWGIAHSGDNNAVTHLMISLKRIYDQLDIRIPYFTVAEEVHCNKRGYPELPLNVDVYCGGYNIGENYGVRWYTIPYIPAHPPIANVFQKDIFCSYSIAHNYQDKVRDKLNQWLIGDDWNGRKDITTTLRLPWNLYSEILYRSIFTLCPRGTNPGTYRFYEAMQHGSIPVYISNQYAFPFENEVDWSGLCIKIKPDELDAIPAILKDITKERIDFMRQKIAYFVETYLSYEKVYHKIIEHVNTTV